MKRVLFCVSTLARTGPTRQLYNVIKYLDKASFEAYVFTLSPEPSDSLWPDFEKLDCTLYSFNQPRLLGLLLARRSLGAVLRFINQMLFIPRVSVRTVCRPRL